MSKTAQELEQEFGNFYDDVLGDDDYGIILGPNGELKSILLPDVTPFKTPKNVTKILKMFNITDPGQLEDPTIH
jgi:hypothetical protein